MKLLHFNSSTIKSRIANKIESFTQENIFFTNFTSVRITGVHNLVRALKHVRAWMVSSRSSEVFKIATFCRDIHFENAHNYWIFMLLWERKEILVTNLELLYKIISFALYVMFYSMFYNLACSGLANLTNRLQSN